MMKVDHAVIDPSARRLRGPAQQDGVTVNNGARCREPGLRQSPKRVGAEAFHRGLALERPLGCEKYGTVAVIGKDHLHITRPNALRCAASTS